MNNFDKEGLVEVHNVLFHSHLFLLGVIRMSYYNEACGKGVR